MRGRDEPQPGVPSAWAPADTNASQGAGGTITAPPGDWSMGRSNADEPQPQSDSPTGWLAPGAAGRRELGAAADLHGRRHRAVTAFFAEVSGGPAAQRFSEDALAVFAERSASGEVDGSDDSLLQVTREVAAQRKLMAPARTGWRASVTRDLAEESACSDTPSLLAARAAGTLDDSDQRNLETHLRECLTCRAAEVRWQRAERAFAATLQFGDVAALSPAAGRPAAAVGAAGVGAAGLGAAGVGAAGVGAAEAAAAAPAQARPERRRRRRVAGVPLAGALALAAACIAAAVIILSGGSSSKHPVQAASHPISTAQPVAPVSVPASTHKRAHAKRVVHHRARPHHRRKAAPPPAAPVTASVQPSAPSAAPVTPVASAPTPVATPVPAPAPAPVPSSSGSGSSGGSSASIQQPSLGASSAPTQTISPKH